MKKITKILASLTMAVAMTVTVVPAEVTLAGIHATDKTIGAPEIKLGKEYTFDYGDELEADINIDKDYTNYYCKVEIPSDGNYTYNFKSSAEDIDIHICDSYYKDIAGDNYLSHESSVNTVRLTAGTYYLRFYARKQHENIHGTVSISKSKSLASNIEYDTKEKSYDVNKMNLEGATDILYAPRLKVGKEYSFGTEDTSFNLNISAQYQSRYYKLLIPQDGIYLYEFRSAAADNIDIWLCDENYNNIAGDNYLALESSVNTKELKKGVYYIRFYSRGRSACGSVRIRNTNLSVKKPAALEKGMKLSWTKFSGASGYEIRYSKKANMLNAVSVDTNSTAGSKTIKKLSSKKTYYVQIRPYVKNAYGTKIYGSWSKKVKVKTKQQRMNKTFL